MKIELKKKETKQHKQIIEDLVKTYKPYLNFVDKWFFEKHKIHLVRPQLVYIALCLSQTMAENKGTKELFVRMCVTAAQAACEITGLDVPEEIEIDVENLKVIRCSNL